MKIQKRNSSNYKVILNLQLDFLLIYRIQNNSVLSVHEMWDRIVRFFQWPKLQQTTPLCSEGFCNIKGASHYLNAMSNYGIKSHNFGISSSHINPPPAYITLHLPYCCFPSLAAVCLSLETEGWFQTFSSLTGKTRASLWCVICSVHSVGFKWSLDLTAWRKIKVEGSLIVLALG